MDKHYDVIIIGSGAGGGTLARHLAPSGKSILILERGDWLTREAKNWDATAVFGDNRYISPETWYDREGHAFQPQVHYFVGGATKMYGAALYRLRKEDFGERQHYDGISPAWPIQYEELEPYYGKAEEMYFVHGERGTDPTEPPASTPYPCPPVSNEPRMQQLFDNLKAEGYHPFPAPCAIQLDEANMAYSTCIRCQTCDGYPCLVHAKSDAEVCAVRPAVTFDNVTLLRNAHALKLLTDASGKTVTEIEAEVNGEPETFRGDIVVVSCGAANSAKLLLSSANDKHPNGLANGSDQVGRHYMFHNSQAVLAFSLERNPTMFQKTVALNDFYFGMEGFDFPVGNIQMMGKSQGAMYRAQSPVMTALVPEMALDELAEHAVDFWLTTEDLPDPDNRVTVDAEGKLTLSYTPNNQVPRQKLYDKLKSMLGDMGMRPGHLVPRDAYMKTDIPIAGCAHQAGTCRFGTDPASSVLDTDCKAHELDNLYVVDTSFFCSIGAVNPSLTAIANAMRVGDHLMARMG
ncbi:GMC family oxidoreductase [Methyloligella sp. 2.7D]|uniref:GMC oxidoreductase n=1 Tax=unclassified Methyloligella TaxID=2625955 RepID=UPI00157E0753|nr:GMC family oxidoreductase [Methyloligella sp. GL2]QKP76693.1 GMC family oxidoreductase [Methyloligella sp. GL2]